MAAPRPEPLLRVLSRACVAARRGLSALTALAALSEAPGGPALAAPQAPPSAVPEAFELAPAAARLLDAPYLTPDQRRSLRVFHGIWDERDLDTPARRAEAALATWDLSQESLSNPEVPVALRARALVRQGRMQQALDLLAGNDGPEESALAAVALEGLGRLPDAVQAAEKAISRLSDAAATPAQLVAAVEAMAVKARVEGQPTRDWQRMMDSLARAREADRTWWPAMVAEGRLLDEKDNPVEALGALHQALGLNPRDGEAWYLLGRFALARFDFEGGRRAVAALRRVNPQHPLAALLEGESAILENDPDHAQEVLDRLLARWPELREAVALRAAADAVRYDEPGTQRWLARMDELQPGGAAALYQVGRFLSSNRQYADAARILEAAVARRPAWAQPRIELGLLEMQSGRTDRARAALAEAARLDPFNKRSTFSLTLLEEMKEWRTFEGRHFVVRCKPGPDEVVAAMMPDALDRMHADVAARFGHEPAERTVIELMPDHRMFGVRITGMPWIHTMAACTGPVIALEVPREGAAEKHLGLFDWLEVLRHEYTHTITLSQTRNRIPHWLTEAAAVSMETKPRSYDTCQLLAHALANGRLFDMDQINWAFVRPKRPDDRALAYAQGHWMVQFMNERFGMDALPRLLAQYFQGVPEARAMPAALGVERADFHREFIAWARTQVAAWGMSPQPTLDELTDQLRMADPAERERLEKARERRLGRVAEALAEEIGRPRTESEPPLRADAWPPVERRPIRVPDDVLDRWLDEHRDHPDLLEIRIRRRLAESDEPNLTTRTLLEAYQAARPVDPLPHRVLARWALRSGDGAEARPHLEALDRLEERNNAYTLELARIYREQGEPARALACMTKAVRIDPYNASLRELAAAVAVEAGELRQARLHVAALQLLEPDRPQHARRRERLDQMIGAAPAASEEHAP